MSKVVNLWQYFCGKLKRNGYVFKNDVVFGKLRQLREEKQLYQKQLATALSIDTPMYCRIEKGERRAKREQIPVIAEVLNADPEELLALWLADQVNAVVADETDIAKRVLKIADNSLDNK